MLYSQNTHCKDSYCHQLSFQRQLQLPKGRHWNQQEREVRDAVENAGNFELSAIIIAMTPPEKLIPNLFLRATLKDRKECFDQVKEKDDPDTRLYCNKRGRFPGFIDDKDPLILEKNRRLDEADIDAVQNGNDVFQLREVLVFSLESIDWAKDFIRKVNETRFPALCPTHVFPGRSSEPE